VADCLVKLLGVSMNLLTEIAAPRNQRLRRSITPLRDKTAAGIAAALMPWPSQKSSSNAALCNFFTGSKSHLTLL
jgi:hypothetical protein